MILAALIIWQVAWWLGMIPAAQNLPLLAVIAPAIACLLHVLIKPPQHVWAGYGVAFILAILVDGSMSALDWVQYNRGLIPAPFPALWICFNWLMFAAGIQRTMHWLRGRLWLAGICGLFGGPLAYWGGVSLGAITMPSGFIYGLVGIGIGYAVAVPVLVKVVFHANPISQSEPNRDLSAQPIRQTSTGGWSHG